MSFNDIVTVKDERTNMGIFLFKEIAEKFNLKQGDILKEDIARDVMIENAQMGIATCKLEIAMRETFDLTK